MQQAPKSLSRLKELARKHKRAHNTTHDEALEHVAREFGYRSYNEARLRLEPRVEPRVELAESSIEWDNPHRRLSLRIVNRDNNGKPCVETEMLPVKRSLARKVFHRIRIGAYAWALCIGLDGDLYIEIENLRTRHSRFVYWGTSTTLSFLGSASEDGAGAQQGCWHLAKYRQQSLCELASMQEDELVEAAYQFGLDTPHVHGQYEPHKMLQNSPAFASLAEAAAQALRRGCPLVAGDRRSEPSSASARYFGEWHLLALTRAGCTGEVAAALAKEAAGDLLERIMS